MKKTVNNTNSFEKFSSKEISRNHQKNVFGGNEPAKPTENHPLGAKIKTVNDNTGAIL